jgi:hypothetical protein
MKTTIIGGMLAVSLFLAGCDNNDEAPAGSAPARKPSAGAAVAAAPVAQAAMAAWQQGDKSAAVSSFVAADWNARPLFASDSPFSLSEEQFKSLSNADRQVKSNEMLPQISSLKQLAAAVADAGHDAAAKGDAVQARKCYTSLKQFGTALDTPAHTSLLQMLGQSFKSTADTELAKLGQ